MEISYPFDMYPGTVLQVVGQFLAERDNGCLDVRHGERGAVLYFPCQIVGVDALPVYYTGVIALLERTYRIGLFIKFKFDSHSLICFYPVVYAFLYGRVCCNFLSS